MTGIFAFMLSWKILFDQWFNDFTGQYAWESKWNIESLNMSWKICIKLEKVKKKSQGTIFPIDILHLVLRA